MQSTKTKINLKKTYYDSNAPNYFNRFNFCRCKRFISFGLFFKLFFKKLINLKYNIMNYFLQKNWDAQNKAQDLRWSELFPVYTLFNYFESLPTI